MPYLLSYCKETNCNFEQALETNISQIFYIVSFIVWKNKEDEKRFKQMQNNYKR